MKILTSLVLSAALLLGSISGSFAEDYVKGVVKKIKPEKGKVTIIHEEIDSLGMPAMTMVFRVSDDIKLEELKPGEKIEFVAERVNGKLTVTDVKE